MRRRGAGTLASIPTRGTDRDLDVIAPGAQHAQKCGVHRLLRTPSAKFDPSPLAIALARGCGQVAVSPVEVISRTRVPSVGGGRA